MWIIPSRNRPDKLLRLLTAFNKTAMTEKFIVVLDPDEMYLSEYIDLKVPILISPQITHGCAGKISYAYRFYPDEPYYGFLTDDCEPITPRWDVDLAKAASERCIAYCNDGTYHFRKKFYTLPVIHKDIIEAVGYISPPGIKHYGLDNFWCHVAKQSGRIRVLDRHIIRLTDSVNKEPYDETKKGVQANKIVDKDTWRKLRFGDAWPYLVNKVRSVK